RNCHLWLNSTLCSTGLLTLALSSRYEDEKAGRLNRIALLDKRREALSIDRHTVLLLTTWKKDSKTRNWEDEVDKPVIPEADRSRVSRSVPSKSLLASFEGRT